MKGASKVADDIEVTTLEQRLRGERFFILGLPDDPRSHDPGWIEVTAPDDVKRQFVRIKRGN